MAGSPSGPSPSGSGATPIARAPAGLAAQLASVTGDLYGAVDSWIANRGTETWPPPSDLERLALTQQKIYGTLSLHPALWRAVRPLLAAELLPEAEADVRAGRRLISLVAPSSHAVTFRTTAPPPAARLLTDYRAAQRRFGVPWQLLAAVNFIESRFGRVVSNSSAGAQGPMQFIPATWAAYGLGGDVHDPHDAIMGAANYLHASGSPGDDAGALYHYNPAPAYVDAVLAYARQMQLDPRSFYAYYNWQVFVLTSGGLRQITGPR
jgi:soluble lytic murein transglycosylase-like protein